MKKNIALFFLLSPLLVPIAAHASAASDINDRLQWGFSAGTDPFSIVMTVVNSFIVILAILAVIALVYGGIQYITSAGDTSAADKGKNTIIGATLGIAVLVASYFVLRMIANATVGLGFQNIFSPTVAHAFTLRDLTGRNPENYSDLSDAVAAIQNNIQWVVWICMIAAFGSILYASFLYLTAYGDTGKMDQAKKVFTLTVIGIIILALGARAANTLILKNYFAI